MWTKAGLQDIRERTAELKAENDKHDRPYMGTPERRSFLDKVVSYTLSLIFDRGVKEWEVDRAFAERDREEARWQCEHGLNRYGRPWICDRCVSDFRAKMEYAPAPPPNWHRDYRYGAPSPFHAPWCRDMHTGDCLTEAWYRKAHDPEHKCECV